VDFGIGFQELFRFKVKYIGIFLGALLGNYYTIWQCFIEFEGTVSLNYDAYFY